MRSIIISLFILIISSLNVNAETRCIDERKEYIEYLKQELSQDIKQVVYNDNNKCYVEIVAYEGKSIEEHKYINASKNRENFINPNYDNSLIDLLNDVWRNIKVVEDINYVPENYKNDKYIKTYLAKLLH